MVEYISGISPLESLKPKELVKTSGAGKEKGGFKKVLGEFMDNVNDLQFNADDKIKKLASGEIKDVNEVMIALTEAEVSFKLMMTLRSKLMEAYREIMKMQV